MESDQTQPTVVANSTTVGLYTPHLQGFYFGELVNQIRQLCFIKGYKLVVIRTGGYGKFNSNINSDQFNGVIILRNAVSTDFVEQLVTRHIACVSVAFDYFPLPIPVISSDNKFGIELAMTHLTALGHKKIAYVGDLGNYDLRKRYEYYCEAHDTYQLDLREDYLFSMADARFTGGRLAAQQFLTGNCDATSIIFGAGLTAIGFLQYLRKVSPERHRELDFVCFDAIALIPVFTPELVAVDLNLHLMAYRSLNVLESLLGNKDAPTHTFIQPKLTKVSSNPDDRYDAFIATCVDLPEFHNPNYIKSIVSNLYDWPQEIADSQLDQILSISPLFEKFMGVAFLFRHFIDSSQNNWLKQIKGFLPDQVARLEMSDSSSLCRAEKFPPKSAEACIPANSDITVHVPIQMGHKIWGFLTVVGNSSSNTPASSFLAFGGYVESLVRIFEQDLEIKALYQKCAAQSPRNQSLGEMQADRDAPIEWNFDSGITFWSDKALEKLGFISAMERNIYSNMEITDRIHKDDLENIRQCVTQCKTDRQPFQAQVKYKIKSGHYSEAVLAGEALVSGDENVSGITFYLGMTNG